MGFLWLVNTLRLRLLLSCSHIFLILLHYLARIHESRAITTNARVLLQLLEYLLALFTFICSVPSHPITVFPVTTLSSIATTTALFTIGLAAPLLTPVVVELNFRALIVALCLLLLLIILILLLFSFLFGIVLGCLLVTVADKDFLRFLKIHDSLASLKDLCLVHHIVEP